ncbi:RHS repeat-associated core domain-containing protein [Pseudomonas sp. CCI1.2]|nr:RHS repeat-associated core domain-containing protein [Pseudomonas sp. CCI1.2]MEB0121638.1 RHS repeat-associated core domain-containing protein [Pseudomonas sp. CCI1.2]
MNRYMTLHTHTPCLAVTDSRGLPVRTVVWQRTHVTEIVQRRVNRSAFDLAGRVIQRWDARLWAEVEDEVAAPANLAAVYSLSGQLLDSDSVDAGWRIGLIGEAVQPMFGWDGRGVVRRYEYDASLRPTAAYESTNGLAERCVERLTYGTADAECMQHNQCGQLIRHDDQAGSRLNDEFGVMGSLLKRTQHFLFDLQPPDWPEAGHDAPWEPGIGATTTWQHSPLGDVIMQTDAQRTVQTFTSTVAGKLKASRLQLVGQPERVVVSAMRYDAQGRVESETLGNGVISTSRYREKDGRLIQLRAQRANGEVLQDLLYDYDPVGNVLRIEDRSQSTHFFANQKIEPVSTYQYDSLYQLIKATGWEAASINHGPIFPGFQTPPDPSQLANYVQTYTYDTAGNLRQLAHVGAQSHSSTLVTAHSSNRSLPQLGDKPPTEEDIAAGFDENGNVRQLQLGQTLEWDSRNQLQQVRPVVRESGNDDSERYIYDASGQRVRKVRITQARAVTHCCEVRYLPGLEIRTNTATGEVLHVITVRAGRSEVRVLHWQAGKSEGIDNDQYRYGLSDHLGSNTVELDREAKVISQEHYYPFGGTAWWAGRSAIEASYKAVRYSGKERDATGLYYYGLRYYAPWLQRWINPDPAGETGGLNLFCFVKNSPLRYGDHKGAAPFDVLGEAESGLKNIGIGILATGLAEFSNEHREKVERGINFSILFLERARTELASESPSLGIRSALTATFGDLDRAHRGQLIDSLNTAFGKQQDFLTSLLNEASWKISLIEQNPKALGLTTVRSAYQPERTILLSAALLEGRHMLETVNTLIHETSHAVMDTGDIFYNKKFTLREGATSAEVKIWSEDIRIGLRTTVAKGPVEVLTGPSAKKFAIAMAASTGSVLSDTMRAEEFVTNSRARTAVLLKNADTYSSFIMSTMLPERYMSKMTTRSKQAPGFKKNKEIF